MRRFVILGTQRTGTTLVSTSLNSHPQVKCLGEAFKAFMPRGEVDVEDSGYRRYWRASLWRHCTHYAQRRRSVRTFLDELYGGTQYAAIGFKLMFNQLKQAPAILDYFEEHAVRAVNVYRENILKTMVSRLSARATGVFHATERKARPKVTIPIAGLIERLARLEEDQIRWRELVGERLPMMRVSYEEFVRDSDARGRQVLEFIGVTPQPLASQLFKLNPDRLRDIVENYDEIAAALAATAFARYLSEPS